MKRSKAYRKAHERLVDLQFRLRAAEVGDRLGIVDPVAAMAGEDRLGDVGRARSAGDAGELEVGIGPSVAVAGLAGDDRAHELAELVILAAKVSLRIPDA